MKTPLTYFFIFIAFSSCQKKEAKLTFETRVLKENVCPDCPKVSIAIPKAKENTKAADAINTAVEEEVITLLHFDEDTDISNLDDALLSFKQGFIDIKNLYEEETTPWEAKIEGKVIYEDNKVLTLQIDSYIFTGGAHGYSAKHFLNFDKGKGTELENWQLFQNRKDFEQFAEARFREQEAIPAEASINQTGLMFESNSFYLPENIGFTKEGVELLYNPYEVASYADGPITLTLPFEDIEPFLVRTKS